MPFILGSKGRLLHDLPLGGLRRPRLADGCFKRFLGPSLVQRELALVVLRVLVIRKEPGNIIGRGTDLLGLCFLLRLNDPVCFWHFGRKSRGHLVVTNSNLRKLPDGLLGVKRGSAFQVITMLIDLKTTVRAILLRY